MPKTVSILSFPLPRPKPPVAQHPAPQLDELEAFVIKSRSGSVLVPYTFLKMDNWSNSALAAAKQNSVIPLAFNPTRVRLHKMAILWEVPPYIAHNMGDPVRGTINYGHNGGLWQ